jgi:hypothetical protein
VPYSMGRTCLGSGAYQGRLDSPPEAHVLY